MFSLYHMIKPIFKTRFFLSIFTVLAFFAPFAAVVVVEHSKSAAKLAEAQAEYMNTLSAADQARQQYSQNIEAKKAEQLKIMADAQAQYAALLKDQPNQIAAHQTTTTVTTNQPVTVKKPVQSSAVASAPKTAPKTTRSTKTS